MAATFAIFFASIASAALYIGENGNGNGPSRVGRYDDGSGTVTNNPDFISVNLPEGLALSGNTLFVARYDVNKVSAYNATSGVMTTEDLITGLSGPRILLIAGETAYVSNGITGQISTYNTGTWALQQANFITLPNSASPYGMAISGDDLFVAGFGFNQVGATVGKYSALNGTGNANFITGLSGPLGLVVSGTDLYVSNYGNNGNGTTVGKYSTLDGTGNASFITGLDGPSGLAISGNTLFVAEYDLNRVGKYYADSGDPINADFITGLRSPVALALTAVPEPGTGLFGLACLGAAALRRRRTSPARPSEGIR